MSVTRKDPAVAAQSTLLEEGIYVCSVLTANKKTSKSSKPMIELKLEIVSPAEQNGKQIQGKAFFVYISLSVEAGKNGRAIDKAIALYDRLGITVDENNEESFTLDAFNGKQLDCVLKEEVRYLKDREGKVIQRNGKPVPRGSQISCYADDILGYAQDSGGPSFS